MPLPGDQGPELHCFVGEQTPQGQPGRAEVAPGGGLRGDRAAGVRQARGHSGTPREGAQCQHRRQGARSSPWLLTAMSRLGGHLSDLTPAPLMAGEWPLATGLFVGRSTVSLSSEYYTSPEFLGLFCPHRVF